MDLSTVSPQIRQLIGQAETAEALKSLVAFLQQTPKYKAFLGVALNIQSEYTRTKIKELKGTVTPDEVSRNLSMVNDAILQVLDQLEKGMTRPEGFDPKVQTHRFQVWQLGLMGVIALGIIALVVLMLRPDRDIIDTECPGFPGSSELNVLLLPFLNYSEGGLKPEYAIKERLEKYCQEYQVKTNIRVYDAYYQRKDAELPDTALARMVGDECQAGLIIWGTVERLSNERFDLSSRFRFLVGGEQFALQKIQLEGETQVDTVRSISSISRGDILTKDIEDLVLTLFGLVAHEQGNHRAAIASLEQTKTSKGQDTSNVLLTQMILADSYLSTQQPEKALDSYNRVLEVHPDYKLARNNHGYLLLRNKKYDEAVKDFSNILQQDPNNKQALVGRAIAYAELKDMTKAREDIKTVRDIDPDIRLPRLLKNVKIKMERLN